jgi:hypothetical protein
VYDREFKRDAYLRMGAREVWIVDRDAETFEVSAEPGKVEVIDGVLRWRIPGTTRIAPIDVGALFRAVR